MYTDTPITVCENRGTSIFDANIQICQRSELKSRIQTKMYALAYHNNMYWYIDLLILIQPTYLLKWLGSLSCQKIHNIYNQRNFYFFSTFIQNSNTITVQTVAGFIWIPSCFPREKMLSWRQNINDQTYKSL